MKKKITSINFPHLRNSTLAKNVILATFFTLIILLGSTSILQADIIHVGGWINSNETWYGGNTYILDSDVDVAEGVQLTILSGCTIHLNHNLRIYGLLHACGNESNWINFGGSGGTLILAWSSPATIGFCWFNSGGYGARIQTDGSVTFNDCVFNNNTNGVLIQNSPNLSFTDCNFNFNTSNGVELENYEHGFSTVTFTNCNVNQNGGAGFNLYGVSQNSATTVNIDNSNIETNGGAGFHSSALADIIITSTVISGNGGDGISVSGYGGYVSGDILLSDVGISENSGRGLYLPVPNTTLTILGYLDIYTNGLVAIEVHANMVGDIPDDSILGMGGNNPDGIHVIGSNITQNATWLKRDNHYTILGDIIIEDTATLQLPTNSYLIFYDEAGLEINGAILADSVHFEPLLYESWKGIYFKNNIPGSVLNACCILNAGHPFDPPFAEAAGIIIYEGDVDSTVTMTNCIITNSYGHGIYINRGASPYIDNCTIDGCSGNGIYISWSSNPIITNCTITSGDSCGIYINYSSNPYIDYCDISDNENYGVFTNQGSNGGTLRYGSIQNNSGPAVRLPANMVRDISTINISGNGRNQRLEVAGGKISDNAVWSGDYDYIIYDDLFLDYGHLTLEAGSVLKFENDVNMDIRTSLTAIGTPDNHIVFTSNQTVPAPGDWDKLYFDYAYIGSELEYCDIQYGGSDGYGSVVLWEHIASFDHCDISHSSSSGMCFWGDAAAIITNSEIHNNATFGVESNPWNSVAHISNTIIHNNGDYAIQAGADEIQLIEDDVVIYDNENNAIKVIGDDVVTGTWQYHNVPYDIEGDITVLNSET
ncbi:MAG: right-handed parallel beta-helix repeat-containing protein, partial [Bacteroidales bacterium]|nr:right-handed parallel beta-helix repeat-containing protein [Bacteroidales bacterium]